MFDKTGKAMRPIEKRTDCLEQLSGLVVTGWFDQAKNKSYFEFSEKGSSCVLTSTYTYKKAKILAKGIQIGRKLSKLP